MDVVSRVRKCSSLTKLSDTFDINVGNTGTKTLTGKTAAFCVIASNYDRPEDRQCGCLSRCRWIRRGHSTLRERPLPDRGSRTSQETVSWGTPGVHPCVERSLCARFHRRNHQGQSRLLLL